MSRLVVEPGRLRHFARLQRRVDGQFATFAIVPLALGPAPEAPQFADDRRAATHRALFRARRDVAPGMRLVIAGRPMAVLAVGDADDTGRHQAGYLEEDG